MQVDLFNSTVLPGNDFNLFVNGNWMKNNPIPDDYNMWGSFEELHEAYGRHIKSKMREAQLKHN